MCQAGTGDGVETQRGGRRQWALGRPCCTQPWRLGARLVRGPLPCTHRSPRSHTRIQTNAHWVPLSLQEAVSPRTSSSILASSLPWARQASEFFPHPKTVEKHKQKGKIDTIASPMPHGHTLRRVPSVEGVTPLGPNPPHTALGGNAASSGHRAPTPHTVLPRRTHSQLVSHYF